MSSRIPNGAIFEGTKGSIVADFTTRLIIPNNDDGDLTYYKRRARQDLLPLIGGTGQVTQARRRRAAVRLLPPAAVALPAGHDGHAERRSRAANGFPVIQFVDGKVPAALGLAEHDRRSRSSKPRTRGRPSERRRLPARMAGRLQGQEQQRRARHQQQDALRFRLLRHDDRADAARPGRAPRRQETRVRSRRRDA